MSDQASQYRAFQWLFVLTALACLWPAFQGVKGNIPEVMGLAGGLASVLCFFLAGWYGWKGAKIRIAEQQKKADAIALITLATFLKDKSEAELEAAVAKGGPAGEAAAMILERRRTGLTRPSGTQSAPNA